MKKSLVFNLAQKAVMDYDGLGCDEKLLVLRILMEYEDLALFTEKQEAKGSAE